MSNNNSLLLKQESKVLKEIKQEEQLDEEDRTLKTLQKEQKHTTEYSSSIELTRAEKLSCICARFKVNDPALREIDLSNFDIFSSDETEKVVVLIMLQEKKKKEVMMIIIKSTGMLQQHQKQ